MEIRNYSEWVFWCSHNKATVDDFLIENMVVPKTDETDSEVVKEGIKDGKDWPQILAILIGCLAALTTGLLYSWNSPFILKISNDKENYNITEKEASHFSTIPSISMMVFSPISSKLCDVIGRKRTLQLSAIPHFISWLLKAETRNVNVFYVARILAGMGDGIMLPSLAMYIGEISTPNVRGTWGNSMTASFYFGDLLITVIGSYYSVRQTSYICMPVVVAFSALFWLMPESPYFYIMKGRYRDAKNTLRIFRRKKKIDEEFLELRANVERQISESGTWKDLFVIGSNRRALLAGVFLRTSQLLGGSSVFMVYTIFIFKKAGGSVSAEASSIIYMTLWFVLNICASFTVDILGKKKSYITSLVPCTFILFVESVYFYIDKELPDVDVTHLKWLPLAGMILYIVFSSFGIGIVPSLMLAELFSASIKAKGLSVLIMVFGIMMFVSNYIFYALNSAFGLFAPFLFFTCCNLVSTVLAFFIIPETKGKTLKEIQQSLKRKSRSGKEVDPFLDGTCEK